MKKNVLQAKKALLALFALLMPLLASAQNKVEIDDIWYNLDESTLQAEVTREDSNSWDYEEYSGSITIPESVTYNGVTYQVTSIDDGTFNDCWELTKVIIPEGVTNIGYAAFHDCRSLTSITIPEGVTCIKDQTFQNCLSLTSVVLPESITVIEKSAFSYCPLLATINIPEGVKGIEYETFTACNSLTDITLPEGLTYLDNWSFGECKSLATVVLPSTLETVNYYVFAYCEGLEDVYCYAETVPTTEQNAFDKANTQNATLHVPASALNAYKTTAPWSSFGNIVALTEEEMSIEQMTSDKSQLIVYDLNGRRVEKAEKGIYIVNGKKTIVK